MRTPTREFSREPTRPVSPGALLAALHSYAEQADTSYIIVAATALERLLEQALLSKMRELSDSRYKDLFTGHGPLATFSAKIEICYALGIISGELVADFHAIRAIRNAFAHADEVLNFSSRQLARLKGWGAVRTAAHCSMSAFSPARKHLIASPKAPFLCKRYKAAQSRYRRAVDPGAGPGRLLAMAEAPQGFPSPWHADPMPGGYVSTLNGPLKAPAKHHWGWMAKECRCSASRSALAFGLFLQGDLG
jgi:DNA-binding MltR family transcriptional regulator